MVEEKKYLIFIFFDMIKKKDGLKRDLEIMFISLKISAGNGLHVGMTEQLVHSKLHVNQIRIEQNFALSLFILYRINELYFILLKKYDEDLKSNFF